MTVQIAPSILSADFAALGEAVAAAERGGADLIHVDVMDGHFVPNITIGPPVVRSLKRIAHVPLDVHLMITDPARYCDRFLDAGADTITFHVEVESTDDVKRDTLRRIADARRGPGLAVSPDTPVQAVAPQDGPGRL